MRRPPRMVLPSQESVSRVGMISGLLSDDRERDPIYIDHTMSEIMTMSNMKRLNVMYDIEHSMSLRTER